MHLSINLVKAWHWPIRPQWLQISIVWNNCLNKKKKNWKNFVFLAAKDLAQLMGFCVLTFLSCFITHYTTINHFYISQQTSCSVKWKIACYLDAFFNPTSLPHLSLNRSCSKRVLSPCLLKVGYPSAWPFFSFSYILGTCSTFVSLVQGHFDNSVYFCQQHHHEKVVRDIYSFPEALLNALRFRAKACSDTCLRLAWNQSIGAYFLKTYRLCV